MSALQRSGSSILQEIDEAAKNTEREHYQLKQMADAALKQAAQLRVESLADADKIAALRATLLYQDNKHQVHPTIKAEQPLCSNAYDTMSSSAQTQQKGRQLSLEV